MGQVGGHRDGIPLAPLTTLRLGGPAPRLIETASREELATCVRELDAAGERPLLLAGGSNVVIADEGVDVPVVRVGSRGVRREPQPDGRIALTVEAGEPWDDVVAAAVADGLAGIECLSGIPGSAGATPIQNVGAYGQEVSGTIASVTALERASGRVVELAPFECGFGYRTSAFKGRDRYAVLAVTFLLRPSPTSEPIRYAELAAALGVEVGRGVPLAEARDAVLALRRAKGMVIDPGDPDTVSAGSFFTNPVLEAGAFAELERRVAERLGPDVRPPRFEAPHGVKTSAAWLIERAGFERGYGNARAGISTKHTLALVNRGGATTAELVALAREIAAGVRDAFGVELVPEPTFVGHAW